VAAFPDGDGVVHECYGVRESKQSLFGSLYQKQNACCYLTNMML